MVRRIAMHSDEDDYFMVDYGSTAQHPHSATHTIPSETVVTQPPAVTDDALERGEAGNDDLPKESRPLPSESAAWIWRCCAACARHLHECLPPCRGPQYQRVSWMEA